MHFLDVLAHKLPPKTFDTLAYLEPNIVDIVLHSDSNVCIEVRPLLRGTSNTRGLVLDGKF